MKKHIITWIIPLLTGIVLSSCDDFLTYEPVGTPATGNYWKTDYHARTAADGLYFWTGEDGIVGRGMFHYINACDDMITGRTQAEADKIKNFQIGNRDNRDNFGIMYQLIKRCNDILINVPPMQITQSVKEMTLGQARFFRAWAYFWICPYYADNGPNGGLPIVTEHTPIDSIDVPRPPSIMANYHLMISDLEKAAELLPYFDQLSPNDYGRPHKTACWAYMSKIYLYMAEYDRQYFAKAEEYADKVINSGKNGLMPSLNDVFLVKNNWNKEVIWQFVSNEQRGSIFPGAIFENTGWGEYNGWGYFMPTAEIVEEFEPGDLRLKHTVMQPGDTITFLGKKRRFAVTQSFSGMIWSKYLDPFKDADAVGKTLNPSGDYPTTTLNVPIFRYAEVLLIKAEAAIMQGKNGDAPINQLRARAGLAPKSGCTMVDLKHERRVELAGEWANRHKDLVRWGDAQAIYAKPLHGYKAQENSDGTITVTKIEVWRSRNFDPKKNHVFPIPTQYLNSSKVLKQNNGY